MLLEQFIATDSYRVFTLQLSRVNANQHQV